MRQLPAAPACWAPARQRGSAGAARAQDGAPGVRLHARAATDVSQLRLLRSHVCTEEPIAEEEEAAPAVRGPVSAGGQSAAVAQATWLAASVAPYGVPYPTQPCPSCVHSQQGMRLAVRWCNWGFMFMRCQAWPVLR